MAAAAAAAARETDTAAASGQDTAKAAVAKATALTNELPLPPLHVDRSNKKRNRYAVLRRV
jgi:hypothetical protein